MRAAYRGPAQGAFTAGRQGKLDLRFAFNKCSFTFGKAAMHRRDVLKTGALAGAGLLVNPKATWAAGADAHMEVSLDAPLGTISPFNFNEMGSDSRSRLPVSLAASLISSTLRIDSSSIPIPSLTPSCVFAHSLSTRSTLVSYAQT